MSLGGSADHAAGPPVAAARLGGAARRYVALGDSFTAGHRLRAAARPGPTALAASLRRRDPPARFRNLAAARRDERRRARPAAERRSSSSPTSSRSSAAPTTSSARPGPTPTATRDASSAILERLRGANPDVRDRSRRRRPPGWDFLELGPADRARVERGIAGSTRRPRDVAATHGVACLDVAGAPGPRRPGELRRRRPPPLRARTRAGGRGRSPACSQPLRIEIDTTRRRRRDEHRRSQRDRPVGRRVGPETARPRPSPRRTWSRFAALTGDWHPAAHRRRVGGARAGSARGSPTACCVLSYAVGLVAVRPRARRRAARTRRGHASSARCRSATRSGSRPRSRRCARSTPTTPWSARLADAQPARARPSSGRGSRCSGAGRVERRRAGVPRMERRATSTRGRSCCDPRRQADPRHRRRQPPFDRLRDRRARPAARAPRSLLTSFGRMRRMTERAAKRLPSPPDVLELDVNSDDDLAALARSSASAGAASTASSTRSPSPRRTRSAAASRRPRARAPRAAFETSAYSLQALAAASLR